jgi:hypothetical protein
MRFLSPGLADLVLYLLPLPAIAVATIVAIVERLRTRHWDVPKAVALGIPIPLAASYFLIFGLQGLSSALSGTRVFAPQAYVLACIGIWFSISAIRGREFSIISTLWIVLIGLFGHLWSVALMSAVH